MGFEWRRFASGVKPSSYKGLEKTYKGFQYKFDYETHFPTYSFQPSRFSRRNPAASAGTSPRKSRGSEGVGWKMSKKQSNWYWKPLYVFSKPLYDEGFPPLANLRHSNPILMDRTLAASSLVTPPRHRPPALPFENGQLCSVIIEPWEWLLPFSSYDSYHQIRAKCGS